MENYVDIPCSECWETIPLVDGDAESFYCTTCDRQYEFLLCTACESVSQVRVKGNKRGAICEWCLGLIRNRAFGRKETATAEDWHSELEDRGFLDPDADGILVTGFTLLGGSGLGVETGAVCSVLSLSTAVDVRAEVGGVGLATIPYTEMTGLDIAGGTTTKGGSFVGGGVGLAGAAEGMLIASVLNSLTRKTTINTGFAIASTRGELLLNHSFITPEELRRRLSPLFTRFNAAKHKNASDRVVIVPDSDPMTELERLAQLRDKGLLTSEEFEAARNRVVRRLTGDES
jgi:Short C-terminal domain